MGNYFENQNNEAIMNTCGHVTMGNIIGRDLYIGGNVEAASTSQKPRKFDTVSLEGQPRTEQLKLEIIKEVEADRNVVVVGLHGMGGIGKTALLKHVYEHFRQTSHFEAVIFTTISATPNFIEIRKQIARHLGWVLGKDPDDNEWKLYLFLESKKYLVILDDIWHHKIDFEELCIHAPIKENHCKILTASRSKDVVEKFVARFPAKVDLRLFPVNKLAPDEAWNLFVQKVGEDITSQPTIEPLAKEVLSKCDGLPLAIIVIGSTMSTKKAVEEWEDAVSELNKPILNFEDVEEEVFSILMFSFVKLEPIQQSLFLYCCLFPEDYGLSLGYLSRFAIGEETLSDKIPKVDDMRKRVKALAIKLANLSMLEKNCLGNFKLHDVMRKFGLWITSLKSDDYQSFVRTQAGIIVASDATHWCKTTKISLMHEKMEALPTLQHSHRQLHTLLLEGCYNIKDFPQVHLLEHMHTLRILDLNNTSVEKLSSSISILVNLRWLSLRDCSKLQELPPEVGKLVQLIWLDLCKCSLIKLPMEMQNLSNLRHLDISLSEIKRMPSEILSGLHNLEELFAGGSRLTLYINEVLKLSELTHLTRAEIPIVKIKEKDFDQLKPKLANRIFIEHYV